MLLLFKLFFLSNRSIVEVVIVVVIVVVVVELVAELYIIVLLVVIVIAVIYDVSIVFEVAPSVFVFVVAGAAAICCTSLKNSNDKRQPFGRTKRIIEKSKVAKPGTQNAL